MSNVKGVAVKPSQSLNLGKIRIKATHFRQFIYCLFNFSDVNQQKMFIKFYKGLGEVS